MESPVKKLPLYLPRGDLKRFIRRIRKENYRVGIALMAYAGLRVSEVCALRASNIDMVLGVIRVYGRGMRERAVPIDSRLQKILKEYLDRHKPKLDHDSSLLDETDASWRYAVKKYSRLILDRDDIHCHTLRCSFIAELYSNGLQVERISELLGQSFLSMARAAPSFNRTQKFDAFMILYGRLPYIMRKLNSIGKKNVYITLKDFPPLIGREKELRRIIGFLEDGTSVMLYGLQGVGKTAILKSIPNTLFIADFTRKQGLIQIILDSQTFSEDEYKQEERRLKRLTINELLKEIKKMDRIVVIDDTTELSKLDRKIISKLAEKTVVAASTSRPSDQRLLDTYIEIKPLKYSHMNQILSEMIDVSGDEQKSTVVDEIISYSGGESIKEVVYFIKQMQLGKNIEEISSEVRERNMVSIAPVLLMLVLFFGAWVLKSYTATQVAMGYALLIVFRMVFMRFIFMPANRKRKLEQR